MITLSQIKAARALLNWTQDQLARSSGLSLPGVNNLERGITSPRKETLSAIEKAMASAGVEFIDTTGVRLKTPEFGVQIIEGPNWLADYDREIISQLQSDQDEILQYMCNNRLWMIYGSTSNSHYVAHRDSVNFSERILAPTSIDFITNPPEAYRLISSSYFGDFDKQIFGDMVAHIIWDARKIVLIKSKSLADSERSIFNHLSKSAKPFTEAQLSKIEKWDGNKKSS